MTTTTTGLAPIATTADVSGVLLDTLVKPVSRERQRLAVPVASLDAAVAAVFALAALVRPGTAGVVPAAILATWPLAVAVAGGYSRWNTSRLPARALLTAALAMATAQWCVPTLLPGAASGQSPRTLATMALLMSAAAYAGSGAVRVLVTAATRSRAVPTVLVGAPAPVRELLREADRAGRQELDPVAVCLPDLASDDPTAPFEDWPVPVWRGGHDSMLEVVRAHSAEAVVVVPGPGITHVELQRWAAELREHGARLLVSPGLRDVAERRLGTATLGHARLLDASAAPLSGPSYALKCAVDRTAGLLLLTVLAPLLGVLALAIRADSPGTSFYRQTRIGRGGRPFTVYKLRTMCAEADRTLGKLEAANEHDPAGVLFKMKRDPRITRLGRFLRLSSLDELPQLLNVVRGEMSLIGPRPALPSEVAAYAPDYRRRTDVRPGLTGLWQVSGRSDLPWDETVRLDLEYVDNWSWSLDLAIAARTLGAVLTHRGAY